MQTADDYFDAANLSELKERWADANSLYAQALKLRPEFPEAYYNRAGNWVQLNDFAAAIADYHKVIEFWPDHPDAYESLAQIYIHEDNSTCRNFDLAVTYAERALELSQRSAWRPMATAASAYAAVGDYAKAIEIQKRAIDLAGNELEHDLWVPQMEDKLQQFEKLHAQNRDGERDAT
jgi:tetratricopeptide (TPR) repeat protein